MSHDAIREFFDGYMECFDRLDGSAAAAYYSAPAFVVKNGGVTRFEAHEKVHYFSSLMESNAAADVDRWEIADFSVARPATNGAIATVRWIARGPDGSVIWDFEDTYVLGDSGNGWRILGDIVHDSG